MSAKKKPVPVPDEQPLMFDPNFGKSNKPRREKPYGSQRRPKGNERRY